MSDGNLSSALISVDAVDECAPTERDPSLLAVGTPSRGVALSVLWWLEGEPSSDSDGRAAAWDTENARRG